jgi:enoyl-CoA hydratase/carnithine racemase
MRRESKRNAINREMTDRLDATLNQFDGDDSLWAGVLAGTDSIFCAGSDLTCNGDHVSFGAGSVGLFYR